MISQRLTIQSVAPSAAVWPEFQCHIMSQPKSTPFGGLRWTYGSKMVPIETATPISIRLYKNIAYLASLGHNTQRCRRQTEGSEQAAYAVALAA